MFSYCFQATFSCSRTSSLFARTNSQSFHANFLAFNEHHYTNIPCFLLQESIVTTNVSWMAYFDSEFSKPLCRESVTREKWGAIVACKFDPAGDELKSWFMGRIYIRRIYIRSRIFSFELITVLGDSRRSSITVRSFISEEITNS